MHLRRKRSTLLIQKGRPDRKDAWGTDDQIDPKKFEFPTKKHINKITNTFTSYSKRIKKVKARIKLITMQPSKRDLNPLPRLVLYLFFTIYAVMVAVSSYQINYVSEGP